MQNALTMPVVLRAAITAKQWIAKENALASSVMGESVSNSQVLAVVSVVAGLCLMPFMIGGDYAVGGLGLLLAIVGSNKLSE